MYQRNISKLKPIQPGKLNETTALRKQHEQQQQKQKHQRKKMRRKNLALKLYNEKTTSSFYLHK